MTKRIWALMATLTVCLSFPAAGVTSQHGGTLNMIAWEGYTQPQWVKPLRRAAGARFTRSTPAPRTRWSP